MKSHQTLAMCLVSLSLLSLLPANALASTSKSGAITVHFAAAKHVSSGVQKHVLAHILNQDTRFIVPASIYATEGLLKQVFRQNPYEYGQCSFVGYSSTSNSLTTVSIVWRQTHHQTVVVDERIKQVLSKIIRPGMNDFEKEKAIHDYVSTHVTYAEDFKTHQPISSRQTAYDALIQGSAVCNGITELTYRMMNTAGIPCNFVTGTAEGSSHAWNQVKLAGNWYDLDVTFDNPLGKAPGEIDYSFYNLTNSVFNLTHHSDGTYSTYPTTTQFTTAMKPYMDGAKTDPAMKKIVTDAHLGVLSAMPLIHGQTVYQYVESEVKAGNKQFSFVYPASASDTAAAMNVIFPQLNFGTKLIGNTIYTFGASFEMTSDSADQNTTVSFTIAR